MKQIKFNINKSKAAIVLFFCCCLLSSCEKAPINGKADGFWQLMSFETTDQTVHECKRLYFSIQLQLIEISDKSNSEPRTYIGRFNYNQDLEEIVVKDFRVRGAEDILATKEQLLPFGMNSTETVFKVIKANGKSLILKSEYATLTLRSF